MNWANTNCVEFTEDVLRMCRVTMTIYMHGRGGGGYNYAVEACIGICPSSFLHVQGSQTTHANWSAFAAMHVYKDHLSTGPSTRSNPFIGLKVLHYNNFCCCFTHSPKLNQLDEPAGRTGRERLLNCSVL